MKEYIVDQNGQGDFKTVQQAIDSIGTSGGKITIKPGKYYEKIHVSTKNITLIGEDVNSTIITYNDHANKIHEDGNNYGTFRSYTMYVSGNNFKAENITFENSAGPGSDAGQALAFYGDGNNHSFLNCNFTAYQDTLFAAPLPPKPVIPGAFDNVPNKSDTQETRESYFESCTITGDVDFIFGGGDLYFKNCTIVSNDLKQEVNGYITAASTPEGQKNGFVFDNCKLVSTAEKATVYLGRPWRNFAKTVFINCYMDEHIKPEGWHNWNKPEAEETVLYAEYASYGPGGDMSKRVPWAKILTKEEAETFVK